jgi:hypothetical protein
MYRHVRQRCKIANSDEGMEKLMDHTLQRQVASLQAQVTELTTLLKGQLTLGGSSASPTQPAQPAARPTKVASSVQVNTVNAPVTHSVTNHIQVQQTVNYLPGLRSFDSEDRLIVPAALVKAAFTENPRLAAYCKLSDEEKTDAETATPYVLEALMELVKRAHKDPLSRNVYLNPKRADQALVFVDSDDVKTWEVRPLLEAIRRIFDTVAGGIHRVIVTDAERAQLPFDVQSSASWIPNLYDDEPDKYVKEAKQPMAAHLTNTRSISLAIPEQKIATQLS